MNLAIRQTRDGSHTLCDLDIGKSYHSVYGSVYESQHVYIKAGLERMLGKKSKVELLEIGFGTGLNALLTIQKVLEYRAAQTDCEIQYTSLEPCPIPMELIEQLNYAQYFNNPAFYHALLKRIHQVVWEEPKEIIAGFYLKKLKTTLEDFKSETGVYDLIYFDPFPPSAQPHLWDKEMLSKISQVLAPGGIFTTYCAKGQFKRNLKASGLEVESPPGPPGKREMTRAFKPM